MGPLPDLIAIDCVLLVVLAWFAIGLIGIAALNDFRLVGRVLFPVSAALSLALAGFALFALPGAPPGLLCLHYHLFLASMALVLLADDAYAFMVTWEVMAISSFFLVTTNHRIAEIRRAGFL